MASPKIKIAAKTTARRVSGIGTRELLATIGVAAETIRQIVAAIPEKWWTTTGSAQGIRGTRRTVKTQGIDVVTPLLTQHGIVHATVSVLKLMMIIPMYAHFSMLRRWLRKLTGQMIDCCLLPSHILRATLESLAYMSMSCLTQERGRQTISRKRRRLGFGRWALNAWIVV